jgi:hypothetical protein
MKFSYGRNFSNLLEIRFEGDDTFNQVRHLLEKDWSAKIIDRFGNFDQGWMIFLVSDQTLVLHYDCFAGVSLGTEAASGEPVLQQIGEYLSAI